MCMVRTKRYPIPPDAIATLKKLKVARDALTRSCAKATFGGPWYEQVTVIIKEVDRLAEITTGEKDVFTGNANLPPKIHSL